MKKLTYCFLMATILLASTTAFSAPNKENYHAVEISIGHGNTEANSAFNKLRTLIANAVKTNVADKFIVYGYNLQGGFSGCVEAKQENATPKAFEKFVKQLSAIRPEAGTTYSLYQIKNCLALADSTKKPKTLQIAKLAGSVSCTLNSGTSLAKMHKDLGIPVYSAVKELSNAASANEPGCGVKTEEYNVYEIAAATADKAMASGFSTYSIVTEPDDQPSAAAIISSNLAAAAATIVYEYHYIWVDNTIVACRKHRIVPPPHTPVGNC
jgi:hypothetical protein